MNELINSLEQVILEMRNIQKHVANSDISENFKKLIHDNYESQIADSKSLIAASSRIRWRKENG